MSSWKNKIESIQYNLKRANHDGWLIYDFRRSNEPGCTFLEIPATTLLTRRFFYLIPREGSPIKIVHRIENTALEHLPGTVFQYASWQELKDRLKEALVGMRKIVMEYSPDNAIPTISKVDAGTMEMVRSLGVHVESSADLLQTYTAVWTDEQFRMHKEAAVVLQEAVVNAWKMISDAFKSNRRVTEVDVQNFLLKEFERHQCVTDHPPICAVNAHAANPHYIPEVATSSEIKRGDFILIDVWCKKKVLGAVYADITRVAVAAERPTDKQLKIFDIVKAGRDAALALLTERVNGGQTVRGYEVDRACRDVIDGAGFGQYFVHRTGHNIGERDHGDGANIDDFETKDFRLLLPGTCFSIEPGIYLPGEFGVRLEDDVYLSKDGRSMHITPGMQHQLHCL